MCLVLPPQIKTEYEAFNNISNSRGRMLKRTFNHQDQVQKLAKTKEITVIAVLQLINGTKVAIDTDILSKMPYKFPAVSVHSFHMIFHVKISVAGFRGINN